MEGNHPRLPGGNAVPQDAKNIYEMNRALRLGIEVFYKKKEPFVTNFQELDKYILEQDETHAVDRHRNGVIAAAMIKQREYWQTVVRPDIQREKDNTYANMLRETSADMTKIVETSMAVYKAYEKFLKDYGFV